MALSCSTSAESAVGEGLPCAVREPEPALALPDAFDGAPCQQLLVRPSADRPISYRWNLSDEEPLFMHRMVCVSLTRSALPAARAGPHSDELPGQPRLFNSAHRKQSTVWSFTMPVACM